MLYESLTARQRAPYRRIRARRDAYVERRRAHAIIVRIYSLSRERNTSMYCREYIPRPTRSRDRSQVQVASWRRALSKLVSNELEYAR